MDLQSRLKDSIVQIIDENLGGLEDLGEKTSLLGRVMQQKIVEANRNGSYVWNVETMTAQSQNSYEQSINEGRGQENIEETEPKSGQTKNVCNLAPLSAQYTDKIK